MDWSSRSIELVWAASLAAVPVAFVAAFCCRWKWVRPATRHALWFAVLATLLSPVIIGLWRPAWFRSERVLAAADTAVETVVMSAKSAKTAYQAMWPEDEAGEAVSTLADQPESFGAIALKGEAPTYRLAPQPESNRAGSRPRRTDHQAPRTDLRSAVTPSSIAPSNLLATNPVAPTVRESVVAGAAPAMRTSVKSETAEKGAQSPAIRESVAVKDAPAEAVPAAIVQPPTVTEATSSGSSIREWLGRVLAVRDAVASVPGIPPLVWLAGALVLAAVWIGRWVHVRRMLRRAEPAPEPLVALVRRLALVAGVKRVPETLVVDDRVSPMIWCGLRPRLVIPRALWGELDARCQSAVIVHELSHLRRRDHRMCLIEGCIGLVYWWHPIAWWARRRLRDEAEACCDAWVTTLLPGGRRAYAEALVATKVFLSVPGRSGAPGLGVVSGRTRQLARRITMVMTQRVAPRASVMGMAFALAVGAAGMFVMPGLACPPEDGKPSAQAKIVSKEAKKLAEAKLKSTLEKKGEANPFFGEAPALEAMRRSQNRQPESAPVDGQMNALKDMETSLQQMEKRLKEMQRRLESMQGRTAPTPRSQGGVSTTAPRAIAGLPGRAGVVTVAPPAIVSGMTTVSPNMLPRYGTAVAVAGDVEARSYTLPKGKLDALVSLMARDDVPIFISSDGKSITVNATPQQHHAFQAFVQMIHPEGHGAAGSRLHDQAAQERAAHEHAIAGQHAATAYRDAIRAQSEQLRAAARELAAQKAVTTRQSEAMKREIERARKNADKAREKARKGDEAEAEAVEEAIERDLEAMESQLEALDGACENLDCQIESIEEAIEALSEATEAAGRAEAVAPALPPAPPVVSLPAAVAAPSARPVRAAVPAQPANPARGAMPAQVAPPAPSAPPALPAAPAPAAAPADPVAPAAPAAPVAPMTTAGGATAPSAR